MKYEELLNELFKFIKLIPDNILSECIESVEYPNRTERRKYDKYKSLDSKIQAILKNMPLRVQLIENLYTQYSDSTDSETLDYDEILSSIDFHNCISKILFMLHRCCDDDFDKKHFSDFIQSDPFQKTINNEWEKKTSANISDSLDEIYEEKNKMKYYLGYIELRNTFYNFKPKFVYDANDTTIRELSQDELEDIFPIYGSLNLAYKMFGESQDFLKSLNVDRIEDASDTKPCTSIYAIKLEENELEDSGNDKIAKKLDLQKLCDSSEDLTKRIIPVAFFNMYKIATPKEDITNESFAGMILINENDYPANEEVLLEYGSERKLFGPFILQERSIDGEKYVRPDIAARKYYLEYYQEDDYEFIPFEKRPYMQAPIYTDIAYIKNKLHYFDFISNSVLLTKLTDSIDTSLLLSNPEEFERLYSTSPFLGDIPSEIRNERIGRIQEILKNTTEYDDTKKKALSTLIDSLDDGLLVNRIQNSKLYKDLQCNYTDLQKDNEDLFNKNNALETEKKNLKQEIERLEAERTTINISAIDSQKIEDLENENRQLKDKLSVVEKFEELSNKYTELQSKFSDEKKLYDAKVREVDAKNEELQEIQDKIKDFITEELNKAGATKMLRTAFDPYISNAMIEAAGNYRVDEEATQYKTISDEMLNFKCQEIEKNALIDSLVEGVQKFRDYEKNDILNMYICLSQNFLTVFSGEPGTGKTSICNILANSLGLNKFGNDSNISKNRYVSVSVERGWSSKRDLIGYFNPLTKKYDRSNAKIYDGLMILNEENKESRFPYLILLDEANLSPMEYYWADFMRAADNSESDVFVNIGLDDKDIYIPKTLHFLATINNDQTTEQLSPRLIDRAWIVKLPTNRRIIEANVSVDKYFNSCVLWSDIEKAFVLSESKEMSLKTVAEQIYKLFDEHHLTVSPRVQQSIKNYVCVAQEIMEDEIGVTKKQKALDFAIVQKLLPKINGYYKDYELLFKKLIPICDENSLKMTKGALITMEEFQRQNMGYCQYLV